MLSFMLLVACISLTLFFVFKNVKTSEFSRLANQLPGPPAVPLFGNTLAIKNHKKGNLSYFMLQHAKYGNVVRNWFGSTLFVTLTDPRDVEILLKDTQNLRKSDNYEFMRPWLGLGLITSTGNHWKAHRKALTPAFHFNITEKFLDVFNEKGEILLKLLDENVGKVFDIFPFINLFALDTLMESSMGIEYDAQHNKDSDFVRSVHTMTGIIPKRSYNVILRSKLLFPFTRTARQQTRVLLILQSFCDQVIKQRKQELLQQKNISSKKRLAFLDLLLAGQQQGNGFTDEDIRDEVNTFLFAGQDTTTTSLTFALYLIANHPEVQDKIYDEIKDIFKDDLTRPVTMEDLTQAKYLEKVIKECMRILPPIPIIGRVLEADLQLSTCKLPARSNASVFIYGLHRNPEFFPEPDKFDPERFSMENTQKRHHFAYVPFSAGPRNCIGQKYAQLEVKSSLIKILRRFQVLPGEDIENVVLSVVLKSTNGTKIMLQRR